MNADLVRDVAPSLPGCDAWRVATFSADRRYRYTLEDCQSGNLPWCAFVMLNPSTADALQDDPTVARCRRFAAAWGYPNVAILNLFALRSTAPQALYHEPDPLGPDNDRHLRENLWLYDLVVAAWGVHGAYLGRGAQVEADHDHQVDWHCLGLTADGYPKHPLYLRGETLPIRLAAARKTKQGDGHA